MALDLSTVTKELEKLKKQIDTLLKKINPEETADAALPEKKKAGRKPKAKVVKTTPDESADDASVPKDKVEETADNATPPKVTKAKAKAKDTESSDRITRVSPTLKEQLAREFELAGVTLDNKFPRAFVVLINAMSKADFDKCDLLGHMKEFAMSKVTKEAGGAADNSAPPPKASRAKAHGGSNAAGGGPKSATPTALELTELQADKTLKEVYANDEFDGILENAAGKKFIGPLEDSDEDMIDVMIDKIEHIEGEKSGRIYKVDPNPKNPDIFVGYKGVGKFSDLTKFDYSPAESDDSDA